MEAVTDVSGTAAAGASGRGATGLAAACAPGGAAYSLDSGTYLFQGGGCMTLSHLSPAIQLQSTERVQSLQEE